MNTSRCVLKIFKTAWKPHAIKWNIEKWFKVGSIAKELKYPHTIYYFKSPVNKLDFKFKKKSSKLKS